MSYHLSLGEEEEVNLIMIVTAISL